MFEKEVNNQLKITKEDIHKNKKTNPCGRSISKKTYVKDTFKKKDMS
jgi:hypothetical protein